MRKIVALAVMAACLIIVPSAFAWQGAHWLPNTCGADLTTNAENGSWWVRVSDESGTLYENNTIPGAKAFTILSPLTVGGSSHDTGFHYVKYEAGNAANHQDGYVTYTQAQANCSIGLQGRPGVDGQNGLDGTNGVDGQNGSNGTNGQTGQTGTNGTSGTSSTTMQTVVVHEAPKVCTSKRHYSFKVRKYFTGPDGNPRSQLVIGATAKEPGISDVTERKITSGKFKGRFQVSWSTTGKHFKAGGTVKTMTVRLSLRDGKVRHVRTVYKYRPCTPKDGNLNDPSATGQGSTGGA